MPLQVPSTEDARMNYEGFLSLITLKRRKRRAPLIAASPLDLTDPFLVLVD